MLLHSFFHSYSKLLAAVAIAASAVALGGCDKSTAEKSEPIRPVLVASVHYEPLSPERSFVGTIRPRIETDMEEDWDVCKAHMERIIGSIAEAIAAGAQSGEFQVADVPVAALCTCNAMMRFFHPQMIAQCADKPGPTLDQMIDFVLVGLGWRHAT